MTIVRPKSRSVFRPAGGVDQDVLHAHRETIARIDRRGVLRGALSLGALTLLSGCDVTEEKSVQTALRAVSSWNDRVQDAIFRPDHLAPTYRPSDVLKPPRFNAHYAVEDVQPVDVRSWKLSLSGLVRDREPWTADDLATLPEQELIVRHVCVEGWDYIGQWSGPNFRRFLEHVGADLTAKYVAFHCTDGYTESIDMPTALHPQTILATKYANEPLTDPFGFPLRLRTSTKLGFKNPKWIDAIEVTNVFSETYYSKEGFNWYSGI